MFPCRRLAVLSVALVVAGGDQSGTAQAAPRPRTTGTDHPARRRSHFGVRFGASSSLPPARQTAEGSRGRPAGARRQPRHRSHGNGRRPQALRTDPQVSAVVLDYARRVEDFPSARLGASADPPQQSCSDTPAGGGTGQVVAVVDTRAVGPRPSRIPVPRGFCLGPASRRAFPVAGTVPTVTPRRSGRVQPSRAWATMPTASTARTLRASSPGGMTLKTCAVWRRPRRSCQSGCSTCRRARLRPSTVTSWPASTAHEQRTASRWR